MKAHSTDRKAAPKAVAQSKRALHIAGPPFNSINSLRRANARVGPRSRRKERRSDAGALCALSRSCIGELGEIVVAAGQGTVALNRKAIDIARRNINDGFGLAESLAGAKNVAEAMELQAAYWRKQVGELASQAGEMRTLSTKVTADVAAPIRAQVTRGMKGFHKAT